MNDNEKLIDQSELAQSVAEKVPYRFFDFFLIKPLDPIKVKKEFSNPVPTNPSTKDANGVEAQDFDKVETEVREVDSDYRKGVIITLPLYYDDPNFNGIKLNIGDIVLFRDTAGLRFDLLKDSRLLRMYDLIGAEK